MKRLFPLLLFLAAFSAVACAPKSASLKPDGLLGDWETVSGYDSPGIFFSPGVAGKSDACFSFTCGTRESGTWELKGKTLTIFVEDKVLTYANISVKDGILTFDLDGRQAKFRPGPESRRLEAWLKRVSINISGSFSAPRRAVVDWSRGKNGNIRLGGFETSAVVFVKGTPAEFNKRISSAIQAEKLKYDWNNISDTMSGFAGKNIVCQAVVEHWPEDSGYSVTLRCASAPGTNP